MFDLLLGEIAGALGGGLLDQMGDIGDSIGGFMDDPGGSMMDAMKDTDLAALINDPENYMNKQIQDFTDKQGRAPSSRGRASGSSSTSPRAPSSRTSSGAASREP